MIDNTILNILLILFYSVFKTSKWKYLLNSFYATGLSIAPENIRKPVVFRWHLKRPVAWNELTWHLLIKPQKSKFWKMKKFPGDIIILHMCNKNHNHMIYGSWDMEWDRQNIVFLGHFFGLPPSPTPTLMIPKIKILKEKKWKKCQDILSFYTYMCTINEDHRIMVQ